MGSDTHQALETVQQALTRMKRLFAQAGISSAALDARWILVAVTGVRLEQLVCQPDWIVTGPQAIRLDAMTSRRLAREPVSRILGCREFYGRSFLITPDVLDPRPDTETVIETTLTIGRREGWFDRPISILDLGTGSGAILLTLLAEFPRATGTGIDVSAEALTCAAANAQALGLAGRCRFERRDIADASDAGIDLIVSNPPYIPTGEIDGLGAEVANFDPRAALDGGADGLAFYRVIVSRHLASLRAAPGPHWLVLEVGAGQSGQVIGMIRGQGLGTAPGTFIQTTDLNGHIRCIAIKTQ